MSWIAWMAVAVVAWTLVGLGVAYVFGRFTHGVEVWGHADNLAPPVVTYLRREKRARASPSAAVHTKGRREAAVARRSH